VSAAAGEATGSPDREPHGSADREPHGSAAEEAARLVDSLHGWFAARTGTEAAALGASARAEGTAYGQAGNEHAAPEEPAGPQHGPFCRACPVCRGLAYVQQAHPEVVEHLAFAAQHVASALRALTADLADAADPSSAGHDGAGHDDAGSDDAGPPNAPARGRSRAVPIVVEPDPDLPNSGPSEQEPEP
jgi:hypothetical protein